LTGLSSSDAIATDSLLTVKQFVKEYVEARSKVLHGTISTLSSNLSSQRLGLMSLVREILVHFAISLASYAKEASPADDIDGLLTWIERERERKAAVDKGDAI
jgi:hypothetical protein